MVSNDEVRFEGRFRNVEVVVVCHRNGNVDVVCNDEYIKNVLESPLALFLDQTFTEGEKVDLIYNRTIAYHYSFL